MTSEPPASWEKKQFEDLAVEFRDRVRPEDIEPEIPYVGLEHIEPEALRMSGVGKGADVTSTKSRFDAGDVLFGKLRPYFRKVIRPSFGGICSTDIWVVRPQVGVDPGYLFYLMAHPDFVAFATAGSEGTRMPRAKWEHVGRYELALPPLGEQAAIAEVLSSLDNRIEHLAELAGNLDGLGVVVFQNAIRNGHTMAALEDVASLVMGQSPPGSTYNEEGIGLPFYQGSKDFGHRYPSRRIYCSDPKRVAEAGDVLISVRAPVGELNVAWEGCCIGRGVAAARAEASPSTLLYSLKASDQAWEPYRAEGTVFGSINQKDLKKLRIDWPEQVSETESVLSALDASLLAIAQESDNLRELRDSLLSPLLCGEIQVADVIDEYVAVL